MKEIAFKAKSAMVGLISGAILFVLFSVISVEIQPDGWIFYFLFSVVFTVIFLVSFFYELKKPNCLIKSSDDILWIYAKGKWNEINMFDITSIKYRRTESKRIVLSSGSLKITTEYSIFKLWNVKNVESVALILGNLKFRR